MAKDLQIIQKAKTLPNLPPNAIAQIGNNNTQIAHANTVIINQGASSQRRAVNPSCCNILVLKGKNFKGNCFSILRNRVHVQFLDAIEITSYPSLFVTANDEYTVCTDISQQFYYGFVNDIEDEPESNSVKIYFELKSTKALYQSKLNEVVKRLGISPIKGKDILGETGWTICSINMVKALSDEGIDITVY